MIQNTTNSNFFITYYVAKSLHNWNHSKNHPYLGPLASRITGVVFLPLAAAADAVLSGSQTFIAVFCGPVISTYNTVIEKCYSGARTYKAYEFSTAPVYLKNTLTSLFRIVGMPFLCLLSPDRAYDQVDRKKKEATDKGRQNQNKSSEDDTELSDGELSTILGLPQPHSLDTPIRINIDHVDGGTKNNLSNAFNELRQQL